jgi:hypothetical protein
MGQKHKRRREAARQATLTHRPVLQDTRAAAIPAQEDHPLMPREAIIGTDAWGTVYQLTRQPDGMWQSTQHGAIDDGTGQPRRETFEVSETIARLWQRNFAEDRNMRATGTGAHGAQVAA